MRGSALPPLRVTVYVCPGCSGCCGVSVTVKLLDEYETEAVIRLFAASRSMTVEALTLAASSASEKTARGATARKSVVEGDAGVTERTCGGGGGGCGVGNYQKQLDARGVQNRW